MLSRIVDLELAMREKENTITSLCNEFEENKKQYEERINGEQTLFIYLLLLYGKKPKVCWQPVPTAQ